MAKGTNKHGLSRKIPRPIRRAVRRACGFGCVICNALDADYDHLDPEFPDCKEHRVEGITLLCTKCHRDKTAGRISAAQVRKHHDNATKRWAQYRVQFSGQEARLRIGSNELCGPSVGLTFGSRTILLIEAGQGSLESWSLSGSLVHGAGTVAVFKGNELAASSGNWDVELEGKSLTFRALPRTIVLRLSLEPTVLGIDLLAMRWPSGLEIAVNNLGELHLRNLRNLETGNRLDHVRIRQMSIESSLDGKRMSAPVVTFGDRNFHRKELFLDRIRVFGFRGVADLSSLVGIGPFLSEDMFDIDAP